MLPEILTIFGCAIGQCQETVVAYNHYNPAIYEYVKHSEKVIKKDSEAMVGSTVVNVLVPAVGWVFYKEATFGVRRDITMKVNVKKVSELVVSVSYNF